MNDAVCCNKNALVRLMTINGWLHTAHLLLPSAHQSLELHNDPLDLHEYPLVFSMGCCVYQVLALLKRVGHCDSGA